MNRYWRAVSRDEFWHGMDESMVAMAFSFVPKELRPQAYETERKAFEMW